MIRIPYGAVEDILDGRLMIILTSSLSVAAICYAGFQSPIPALLVGGTGFALVFLLNPRFGIATSMACLAWDQLLNPSDDSGFNAFSVGRVMLVGAILVAAPKAYRHRRHIQAVTLPIAICFLFLAWWFISIIWAFDRPAGAFFATKIGIQVVFLLVASALLSHERHLTPLLAILTIGFGTAAICAALSQGNALFDDRSSDDRLAVTGSVIINAFMMVLGFGVLSAIQWMQRRPSLISLVVATGTILASTLCIFLSGTRSVFVGLPTAILVGSGFAYWRSLPRLIFPIMIMGGSLILCLIVGTDVGLIDVKVTDRLFSALEPRTYTSNIRLQLWAAGVEYSFDRPLGTGSGCERYAYNTGRFVQGDSHSAFVSTLVQTGYPGLIILLLLLGVVMMKLLRMTDPSLRFASVSWFVYFVLQVSKIGCIQTRLFWLPLTMIIIFIQVDASKHREIPNEYPSL